MVKNRALCLNEVNAVIRGIGNGIYNTLIYQDLLNTTSRSGRSLCSSDQDNKKTVFCSFKIDRLGVDAHSIIFLLSL